MWLPSAKKLKDESLSLEERCKRLEDLCERLVAQVYDLHKDKEALQGLVRRLLRNMKQERKAREVSTSS